MDNKPSARPSRRRFLAGVSAAAAVSLMAGTNEQDLALRGGKPVRATVLSTHCPGAQFYDNQEVAEVKEAVETHSLFRWYGFKTPVKVRKFEQEFAKFVGVKYALGVTSGTAA